MQRNTKTNINVLDLFSGCGGLSYGFYKSGYSIIGGVDNWKESLITFQNNHPGAKTINMDLGNYSPSSLDKQIGRRIDVIIGGPPCQGFSISGKRDPGDPRNNLYRGFVDAVRYFKPKAFLLENVPNLISMANGSIKDRIIKDFTTLGYGVVYGVLLASDFGVPQNRKRVFFIGLEGKSKFSFPIGRFKYKKRTCGDAISDLPKQTIKNGGRNEQKPQSDYQKDMRKGTAKIYNHVVTKHQQRTIDIISLVPDGGNYKNLPAHLRNTRKVNIAWTRFSSNKPSYTIDTGHRHHFHYKYNRVPTVRESARIQSFPDDFIFYGSKTSQYHQVGNAVPPLLAKVLAVEIKKHLT